MPIQQEIYPVRYVKPMAAGKSNPQLIELSDNLQYVVKFKNSKHGTRALVNEYVVGKLAQILSLPVVPFRVVYFSKDFMVEHPQLCQYDFEAGNQFASLYIRNCTGLPIEEGKPFPTRDEINNVTSAAGIIVFDHWVCNLDRGSQNILLECLPNGGYDVYIIDHGKCFPGGFHWTSETLKKMPEKVLSKNSNLWCASLLNTREEMAPYIDAIQNISDREIYEIIRTIPEDWEVTDAEKDSLVVHLVKRKKLLPDLITQFSAKIKIEQPFTKKKKKK